MPDDQTLRIGIEFQTNAEAATTAGKALETVKTNADAAAAGTKKLSISADELSDATKRRLGILGQETADTKKVTEATEGLDLSKRELLESTHAITREMPVLGEIMRAAYNGTAFSIFGVIGAMEIWIEKTKTLTEAFGGMELPRFTNQIKDAQDIAVAYDGIGKAIRDALAEFNSAPEIYGRQKTAIDAQVASIRSLIQANKDKAQADLDIERAAGKIGPAMFAARKSAIEQGYTAQTEQLEKDARTAELKAKQDEQKGLEKTAADKAHAAAGVKLPEDDAVVDAQIAAQKNQAAALRKQAEDQRAEADKLQVFKAGQDDHSWGTSLRQLPEAVAFSVKYGATTDPGEIIKARNESAKDAEEKAIAADREAQRLEKAKADRETLRKQSEDAAAAAQKLALENAGQDDPKKVGSVAWQNAQADAVGNVKNTTALENRFTSDAEGIAKDIQTYAGAAGKTDPRSVETARAALADMFAALRDAASVMEMLKNSGVDISSIRRELNTLKAQVQSIHTNVAR